MGRIVTLMLLSAFCFFFAFDTAFADTELSVTDIERAPNDTNKVKKLIDLVSALRLREPDSAVIIARRARTLAEDLDYPWGIGYSLKFISLYDFQKGNYVDALESAKQALTIFEKHGIRVGEANMLNNIGTIYFNKSLENEALAYYLKSLKISEELNDTLRIATALTNVGSVYSNKPSTLYKSLDYHRRALPLFMAVNDSMGVGSAYMNIGELYYNLDQLDSSRHYVLQSIAFLVNQPDLAFALNLLGKLDSKHGNFQSALRYHDQALNTAVEYESKIDIMQSYIGLATVHDKLGNHAEAILNYKNAEELSNGIGLDESYDIVKVYEGLANLYAKISDFKNSYAYQKRLLEVKDKIYTLEVDKKLGTKLFEFEINKKQLDIDRQSSELSTQRTLLFVVLGGLGSVLVFAFVLFSQRNKIKKEKRRSDELLLNILPEETAEELKTTGRSQAKAYELATVMFSDFKDIMLASEKLSAEDLVGVINLYYSEFDRIVERHGLEKIKTIGDSYMCVGGVPLPSADHPARVVAAAVDIAAFIDQHKKECIASGKPYFEARIGIHSGPVIAGIVGLHKFAFDIWGDTVNTASRMQTSGEVGKVNISGATYELVKDHFSCTHRGKVQAKNKGEIDMYFIQGTGNRE